MSEDLIKEKFDNHEERITQLEKNTRILETMNYRIGQMETSIKSINDKLDIKDNEKGKKWDKLIDYLFYFVVALILGYVAFKLGIKK
jgi:hypothetical protein